MLSITLENANSLIYYSNVINFYTYILMKKLLSIVLVVVLLLGGGGFLLATAADASTPGDALYAIDLVAEDIQRALTTDDLALAEFEQDILEERAEEVELIVEEGVEGEVVQDALDELEKQRDRTQERLLTVMSEDSKYNEAERAEVTLRYEKLVQEQIQKMEEVQIKYENVTGEAKKGFEDAVITLESLDSDGDGAGNEEKNDETGDSGDGIKDRESNSDEDTGNDDPSGEASQTGR